MKPPRVCNCSTCNHETLSTWERTEHGQVAENSRRDFLKTFSLALAMANSGLPLAVSALNSSESELQSKEMFQNKAVKKRKVNVVSILHTADIHGQLFTHDEFFIENGNPVYKKRGGYAVLKTMINELRAQNPANTMLIDGGDCFQGSGLAALSKGKAMIPLMNNLNYDLVLPGNWEVVYGKEMMIEDLSGYTANKVCANMYHQAPGNKEGDLIFPPYFVKNIGGLKIGFIGYNDPLTPKRQSPAYSEGIIFTHPEKNVTKYIEILRRHAKCDMVILLTHMGLAQQVGLADMPFVKGVDYILGADTHERVRQPLQREYAKVTEPGAFGSFVAKLDIAIEKGQIKEHSYQLLDVDPDRYPEDAEMKSLVNKVSAPYRDQIDRVIGTTKAPLVRYYVIETPMDNFLTDAIMWKFKPDIALSNGFRFCPPLVPDPKTGKADITVDFLWSMMPDDSQAKQGKVTGKQLWDYFETELHNAFAKDPAMRFGGWLVRFKGMELNFTIEKEKGKRVNWIKVKGEHIDLDSTYTIIACERDGDPDTMLCRMEHVKEPKVLGTTLHKVIEEYLAIHSPVSPRLEGRAVATDAPATLLTQLRGVGYEFR
ncbi:MAG TPA: bifunctional metallophosphatase/5'-nucleotidase [Chryseosolibacter sp.]|nr:bifunctional metallophosphatase/5'-nucleotidase [Chryseosolibacter sp.]